MNAEPFINPVTGSSPTKNPYIGPRPFQTAEKDRFFGRENEANALIPLVIAERLVLFYSESGAGKSSLINARLIPGLELRNFKVLTGRVGGQSAKEVKVDNIYVYNLLLSLENSSDNPIRPNTEALRNMKLAEYLADLEIDAAPSPSVGAPAGDGAPVGENQAPKDMLIDAPQIVGGIQPLALIIDQFEEIFTTHSEEWKKRADFFDQLRKAQQADPFLWVVLAIREDYVARLDPYAPLLHGGGCARFYMERMGRDAALEAIQKPAAGAHPFAQGVAEELVDNLRRLQPGEYTDSSSGNLLGQYVEPVQLQVVCYQLWEQLKDKEEGSEITREDLIRLAGSDDLAKFISGALAHFYEQAIASVVQEMRNTPDRDMVTERKLRDWFNDELITEMGTCNLVFRGEASTGGMPNRAAELLVEQFIIRPENRGAGTWYELSHDRFVPPIMQSNREWNALHSRPIVTDTEAWLNSGKAREKLYEGRQLREALLMLNELRPEEREFIQAGQFAANQRQASRNRTLATIFTILMVILTFLTLYSINQTLIAGASARDAQAQKSTAVAASGLAFRQQQTAMAAGQMEAEQRQTAVAASLQEAQQRKAAESAASTAEAASTLAGQQVVAANLARATALAASEQAQSSRLASLSDYFRDTQPDLGLLLAVESAGMSNGLESRRALLNSIQRGLANRASRSSLPWYVDSRTYGLALSPDGRQVAASTIGHIYLWDVASRARIYPPVGFAADYSMYALAFDSTGQYLARGGADGKVMIWDRQANVLLPPFRPFELKFTNILSIAFQPGGSLLAVSTDIHPKTGKGHVYLYDYKKPPQAGIPDADFYCGEFACSKVAWSPDGSRFAIASQGGVIQIIDMATKTTLWTIPRAHNGEINGLAWYPDGRRLVSSGYDQQLIQWDVDAQKILRQAMLPKKSTPNSLALSPDGRYLLAGINNSESMFGVWDAVTLQRLDYDLTSHTRPVAAVAFSPQGSRFVTAGYDNAVFLWNFEPVDSLGKVLVTLPSGPIETMGEDAAGRLLLARNPSDGTLDLFTYGMDLSEPRKITAAHSGLAFTQVSGRLALALGGVDGQVSFINPLTGENLASAVEIAQGQRVSSLAVSADGKLLATIACRSKSACDQLTLLDLSTGQPLKADISGLKFSSINALAFSPDAKTLAIGSAGGQIALYQISTGASRFAVTEGLSLQTVTLAVTSLAFSPDQQGLLFAGFQDGRIALWDATSLGPVGEFVERLNGEVTGLLPRQGSDGAWALVSVSNQGEVREWAVDPSAWVARACQMAGRNLTPGEKAKFLLPGTATGVSCPATK